MRKLRMGMIGGGIGSFIGDVHRKASLLDGKIDLVCGAFSSDAQRSIESGKALFLPPERCYENFEQMILAEKQLPKGEKMDFASIVTPNHIHFAPSKMALENGFHVVCDKPITFDLEEVHTLQNIVRETGLLFALTHNYTAYPMVKQAKLMVEKGRIGKVRKIVVQYHQGWLSTKLEDESQKQATWRTDPRFSGIAGAIGDIGIHAENIIAYISGLELDEVAADLNIFVENRLLDDDANILLRYKGGAKGIMSVSQVAVGEENSLIVKIYGEKGSLEWKQEEPNTLIYRQLGEIKQYLTRASFGLYPAVEAECRIPSGHPEGYLECFASVYKHFADHLFALMNGDKDFVPDYPSVKEGVEGMNFIYATVESSKNNANWTKINFNKK